MNIWKVIANEGYNNAYLTDNNGVQHFDPVSDFKEINDSPPTRLLKIEVTDKGFPDIMNYWGMNGTIIVNSKLSSLKLDISTIPVQGRATIGVQMIKMGSTNLIKDAILFES